MTELKTTGRHVFTDASGSRAIRRVQWALTHAGIVWSRIVLPGGMDRLEVVFEKDADRARRVAEGEL